jgi:hypothetical protein
MIQLGTSTRGALSRERDVREAYAAHSGELYGFATVKTDKADYSPGTTVTITGGGWVPGRADRGQSSRAATTVLPAECEGAEAISRNDRPLDDHREERPIPS